MAGAIDFNHLEHYVGGDQAIIREVLALFSDQARTVLPQLDPEGPADQWRGVAHSLKGSALGIGALDLAAACGDAEQAHDAPPPRRPPSASASRTAWERCWPTSRPIRSGEQC
jgi:HPt (histidine-containing phosphotransfer) domain-containing protein